MESNGRLRSIGRMTGVVATSAPTFRRLARDQNLRSDASDFVVSGSHLIRDVARDRRLRRDARRMLEAAQSGREHLRRDVRPRGRGLFTLGLGMILGVFAIAGALLYPRTRQSVLGAADQTMVRASATVHDIRQRFTGADTPQTESAVAASGGGHIESATKAA
jgi:hypothetical protein